MLVLWITIELSDAQECGFVGVNRVILWKTVLRVERGESPVL